jgi:kinesin family protein 4/21/27
MLRVLHFANGHKKNRKLLITIFLINKKVIYGANEIICTTLEEVMACFDAGTLLRHTGSTLMNEQSSRSHSVFTVSIEQRWTDNNGKSVRDSAIYDINNVNTISNYYLGAKFHFVDLAGSERVHRTGNIGDRFKESIHINTGLLALGNVISALSSNDPRKRTHIPYRESKITRILKDSLGGNANTLMICCISPSSCNLDESINALKYASRVNIFFQFFKCKFKFF